MKKEVILAKSAGFCFGVNRAMETVYELIGKGKKVYTLGPIVHNPQIVMDLEGKGVKSISSPDEAERDSVIVIRAHGVTPEIKERILSSGCECCDATCPFVQNIHKLVKKASDENKVILMAGDINHPEVEGILGENKGEYYTFQNESELLTIIENHPDLVKKDIFSCAQTTFNVSEWKNCLKTIKKVYTNASIFDTICNATAKRQAEAEELSKECDAMVVVGGKNSSNTQKLRDVCKKHTDTYLVETAAELPENEFKGKNKIGITAGASTPASIIKEVLVTMTEILEKEMSFEEMLEESLKSLNTDEKVRGIVSRITATEVYVEVVGRKQTGYIPADEISADPAAKPEDVVKIGDELELLIMKTNDQEGTIMLSKKRVDAGKGWDVLANAKENDETLTGKVTEVVKSGIVVMSNGIRVFIPGSHATNNRGESLDGFKGKEISFKVLDVDRPKRRAVGSIRAILREERKAQIAKFWEEAEEGKTFTGKVKSLTSFGAFVDLGGVDGLVHITELSWNRIKNPSEVVAVGDEIDVYIKSVDKEAKKISLGHKKAEDNPWEIMKNQYPAGTVCEATIVSMTTFGAFARIIPGVDGLVHISQIADKRIEKPQDVLKIGDVVNVKVIDIDFEKKRVSLSIKEAAKAEEATEEAAE
ncbi:MAG: bifunctional 4-hydroxy-3-methylbut-2-enyl diphosphate reductase/30S ribosomal protein S1 [Clostridia bacterium]|nr:bifunctional 4-hydroxy-3-methylbut-2-enyl diphosphate reductase/30S ribosomal protein S1 [Clostridia bacterium]